MKREAVVPFVTAGGGLLLGVIAAGRVPSFDQLTTAVRDLGFPIVIALALLLLLTYVIFDAVRYFTARLDRMSGEHTQAFRDVGGALGHLSDVLRAQTEQIVTSREQYAKNNQVLEILVQFISHTQQEMVAHRRSVEGDSYNIPSPPIIQEKKEKADNV